MANGLIGLINLNLSLNGHMWLVAILLDSRAKSGSLSGNLINTREVKSKDLMPLK